MRLAFGAVVVVTLLIASSQRSAFGNNVENVPRKRAQRRNSAASSTPTPKGNAIEDGAEIVYTVSPPPPGMLKNSKSSKKRKDKKKPKSTRKGREKEAGKEIHAAVVAAGIRSCNPSQPIVYANATLTVLFAPHCTKTVRGKLPPSTSFFVNSRTMIWCTDSFRRGSAHPISVLSSRLQATSATLC